MANLEVRLRVAFVEFAIANQAGRWAMETGK